MKYRNYFSVVALAISLLLTGCMTIKPEKMQDHLTIISADDNNKTPVVFFFQASSGNNRLSAKWTLWFAEHGVSAVWIDSASVRGLDNLFGKNYGGDLSPALKVAAKNSSLDLTRYALMGFSRGGTAALRSASFLAEDQPRPELIFSLYPADHGRCPNSYDDQTKVHVFYGELDDWGTYQGNRNSCETMAEKYANASYYPLENAHHAYDGNSNEKWKCCGGKIFTSESNAEALAETKRIILAAMQKEWGIN